MCTKHNAMQTAPWMLTGLFLIYSFHTYILITLIVLPLLKHDPQQPAVSFVSIYLQ